jgi:hypothetical protein
MASRPLLEIEIDGTPLAHWPKKVTLTEPEGGANATLTIEFAGPSTPVSVTSDLVVRMGYTDAGLDIVFDSSALLSSQYTIEPHEDGLTATWASRTAIYRRRAPLETEYWRSRGRRLRDFAAYIAGRVGYGRIVTNIPNLAMPRRTAITPEEGYWGALNAKIDPLRPFILPDDQADNGAGVLYIWWLDGPVHGEAITLPVGKGEGLGIPKTTRQLANVCTLKYLVAPSDGGELRLECAKPGAAFAGLFGEVGTTLAGCGVEIDPSADAEIVERRSFQIVPAPEEGGEGTLHHVMRKDRYAVLKDEDGETRSAPVLLRTQQITWQKAPSYSLQKIQDTTTTYRWIKGTRYQHSAGHRLTTAALMPMPLVGGEEWVSDLYSETETIEYLVLSSGDLLKYRATKQATGRVLEPDHVALYEAGTNRTVRVESDSYQWTEPRQHLFWEIEELQPAGGSVKYTRRRFNALTRKWEGPGDAGDAAGQLPSTADLEPDTVEETYPDPQYADGAGGYNEPEEGWQIPVIIDGTWIGTSRYDAEGEDPLDARSWCVRMANAVFRRAGKRLATYTATYRKYLSKLHRGAIVETTKRNHAQPHSAIVTSRTVTWTRVTSGAGRGGYTVTTAITARRMEPGEDA